MLFFGLMASLTHPGEDGTAQTQSGESKEGRRNLGDGPKKRRSEMKGQRKPSFFFPTRMFLFHVKRTAVCEPACVSLCVCVGGGVLNQNQRS